MKFKLGDILKHKGSGFNPVKLVVIASGVMVDESGTSELYVVSFQKPFDAITFHRAYLCDAELEHFNNPTLEPNTISYTP